MLKEKILSELSTKLTNDSLKIVNEALTQILPNFNITPVTMAATTSTSVPTEVAEYVAARTTEGFSSGTLQQISRILKTFFVQIPLPVQDVKTNNIRFYLSNYKTKRKIADNTLESIRTCLNSFFAWCEDEGYITKNPCRPIKHIKAEYKQRLALTDSELKAMRKACTTTRDTALIEVLYSTGCRISEIVKMTRDDIDWTHDFIKVAGKGKKERLVFLTPAAHTALQKYLDDRHDTSSYLFVTNNKNRTQLTTRSVEIIYEKIVKNTKGTVRDHSPHSMRHTTATLALNAGMPIESISKMLGHSNINTTMIYAEVNPMKIQSEHKKFVH